MNVGGSERLGIRALAEEIGRALGVAPRFVFTGGADPPGFIADRTFTRPDVSGYRLDVLRRGNPTGARGGWRRDGDTVT